MKTYLDYDYQTYICDIEKLYHSYKKCHEGKAETSAVIEFDKNVMFNLHKIKKDLESKNWKNLFSYYNFKIYYPKERDVWAMNFTGRIIQHSLCDYILNDWFEKHLIYMNVACRKGKGTDFALRYVKERLNLVLRDNEWDDYYVLKMDIHHFFESIDRNILKNILNKFPEGNIKEMLFYIIDSVPTGETGIPIGNQTSQWFALYYLDDFDRIIKEKYKIKNYVRYMDDAIIISKDKKLLQKLFKELKVFLEEKRNLEFNPKSCLSSLKKGFDFLGWHFFKNKHNKLQMRVSKDKLKLRKLYLGELNTKFNIGDISEKEYLERTKAFFKYLIKGKVIRLWDSYFAPRIEKEYNTKHNLPLEKCIF